MIPLEESRVEFANEKRIVVRSVSFEAPQNDDPLSEAVTDSRGVAAFRLSPADVTTDAGTIVTTTTTDRLDERGDSTGREAHATRRALSEKPDVYFLASLSERQLVDTRMLASGLVMNLASRRLGSASSPLTFVVGAPTGGTVYVPGSAGTGSSAGGSAGYSPPPAGSATATGRSHSVLRRDHRLPEGDGD